MSNGWLNDMAHAIKEYGFFGDWAMFENPNGVPYHESLSDLRHFMCNSIQLRLEVENMIRGAYWDQDQRKQAWTSFVWMMITHAAIWELRGWHFEPDEVEVLQWL